MKYKQGSIFACSRKKKRICCIVFLIPVVVVLSLLAVVLIRTFTASEKFHLKKFSEEEVTLLNPDSITKAQWADRLAGAISFPTVSRNATDQNSEELSKLQEFLRSQFPNVFSNPLVRVEVVNKYSLLIKVEGKRVTSNPYLLCGHLDVVPAGDRDRWDLDPFLAGVTTQAGVPYIYGRGAVDNKHEVVGILQAVEILLENGGQPERTLYVAFGHDEEVGGRSGAQEISGVLAKWLREEDQQLDFLLDEGMFVLQDVVPGLPDPVVYIGVVEKGWALVELSVSGVQTHSSTPPRESTIGILARAITRLENNPSPSRFNEGPEYDSMSYLASYATFLYRMILSNLWLLHSAVSAVLAGSPDMDAIQRTTTAVTIIQGGLKDNVMPGYASAIVNHRIHPIEDLESILEHDRKVISDDRVTVTALDYGLPPKISPYSDDSVPYQIIANSAVQVFPTSHVTPGTLVANTDTKHYLELTDNVYRFSPAFITPNDTTRFHGYNERISVDNFVEVVEFYYRVIKNADTQVKSPEYSHGGSRGYSRETQSDL